MWVRGVGGGAGRGDRERPVLAPAGSVPSRGTPPATGATRLDASLLVTRRQGGRERGLCGRPVISPGVLGTPAGRGR